MLEAFEGFRPDFVVHAAASYKDPDAWGEDVLTNALGTVNVVRAAQATGVERLLYFQTALCYGTHADRAAGHARPPDPARTRATRISKTAGEQYIELSGLDFVSFRLANAYGPRNISGPLPTFYHRLTEGKAVFVMDTRRDFIYVDDLIDVVDAGGRRRHRPRALPRVLGHRTSRSRSCSTRRSRRCPRSSSTRTSRCGPQGEDDAYTILLDPSRIQRGLRLGAEDAARGGRRAARSSTTASTASPQTYTHLKVGE